MKLTEELRTLLYACGANLVGVGDMRGVENCCFQTGVAVAVKIPAHVVCDLQNAPTKEYYDLYYALNKKLNEIIMAGEDFLQARGYVAWAQTTGRVKVNEKRISNLPHKTVATRGGLGWIGKNCLLVTPQYGCAIRLSSLLTNAPLVCDAPIAQSQCGVCRQCVEGCPAQALKDTLWTAGMDRESIVDVESCYRTQMQIMLSATGIEADLCGKCFALCPYTQKYLQTEVRTWRR